MLNNKEAGMVEPSKETIDNIEKIKNKETLAEKIEQIGFETQCLFANASMGNISSKSKDELDQIFGDIWYYMNFLRTLTKECPEPNKQAPIKTMDDAIESLSNWNDKLTTLIDEILDDPTDDLVSTPKTDDAPDTDESGINLIELATRWKPSLDDGKWPMWIQIGPGFHGVEKDKHKIFHAHFKAVSGETGIFSLENMKPPKDYSEIIVLEGEIPDEYKKYIVDWANEKSKSYPNYDNWYVAIDDWCASCFRIGNIAESVPLKEIGTVCEKDDGWGMVIEIHSDDHGVLYDKNNPAFARIKDHNDKYLGQFMITKEKPSSVDYVFDCDNKHIIPAEYKHKIVEWASKPSPKYDEEDGIATNWGAVKASWKNLHPENE
jgi:hypothetical protein